MSVGVTEPNRAPVGPAFTSKRSTVFVSVVGDLAGLLGGACLVARAVLLDPPDLGDPARRRHLGELPRQEVVAGIAALDVDDVALEAELLDVAPQDDLHHDPCTYGRSAISRARFTATATCRWWRRHAPVMRRLRILPFSEM